MNIIVFEDPSVTRLYPITLGRPAYAVSCASLTLFDLLRRWDVPCRGVVRPYLQTLQRLDYTLFCGEDRSWAPPLMLINARTVPSRSALETWQRLARTGQPGAVHWEGELALALLPGSAPHFPANASPDDLAGYFHSAGVAQLPSIAASLPLLRYPHDAVRFHMQSLAENLTLRLADGPFREVSDGVFASERARLGDHLVFDTRGGPVLIDRDASLGPFSYVSGPVYVGPRSRVNEHAALKDGVAIGHTCKIGGEVEASIIEPFTNKQHHGFLGHSYLGSWINLGAGTCNSDLKNTYGDVKMEYQGQRISTGMQFIGCIMGDYAKTAINTGIFTGKTIGACSMLYGFVTTNVPSFVNYARLFGQVTELPPEVMIATQRRMYSRRNVQQRPCDEQLIRDMYDLTRDERQLTGEPLAL